MVGKRLLMIGWEAADWVAVHPLLDAGRLPNLMRLVETGCSGTLSTHPPFSLPIVATSLATGRHPEHHGVASGFELRPDGGGVRRIGRQSWRAPAFWEILAAGGFRTAIVNWPATSPADAWPGIVIDEEFPAPLGKDFASWPLPPRCVSPESWRPIMGDLRVHPAEIGSADLAAFLPEVAKTARKPARLPARLAVALAGAASVHAAATHLAEAAEWNMLAVRYALIADVARTFAATPQGRAIEQDAAEISVERSALATAYRFQDMMLGRLLELAGPETTILIVAPQGAASSLPDLREAEAADPPAATIPRDRGVLIAAGPGIASDAVLHGARVIDLCPTILRYFGLSAPSDGRVLEDLFKDPPPQPKPAPAVAPPVASAPVRDPAAHLAALGYVDRVGEAEARAIAGAETARLRNLADSHLALSEWQKAATCLRDLLRRMPGDYLATIKLCRCLLHLKQTEAARPLAAAVLAAAPEAPWGDLLMGSIFALEGDVATAEVHLRAARGAGVGMPEVMLRLGWVAVMLRHWAEADAAFREVLANDETIAEAHTGLGISLQAQGMDEAAEAALRRSIGLAYHNPVARFHLGQILAGRGAPLAAADELRTALAQQPGFGEARDLLAKVERILASALVGEALADRGAAAPDRA